MSGFNQSGPAPVGVKIDDKQVIAMMTNRHYKAQAPSGFQTTGPWKTRDDFVRHFLQSRGRNIKYLQTSPENRRGSLLKKPMGVIDVYQATAAAIDRPVHHSVILELNLTSYRIEQAKKQQQPAPVGISLAEPHWPLRASRFHGI